MKEQQPLSMAERWRRIAAVEADDRALDRAMASLAALRNPRVRIRAGAIQAEMEGTMGALHEVSVQAPPLPARVWPQVVRVLRRSASMLDGLRKGLVPRSFDRLIARIAGEAVFPEPRRISSACTCSEPERPCRHILALHELFARRLDEKPYELLVLRGVPLRDLLDKASRPPAEGELPPLAFGAREEPVLFPEGAGIALDTPLSQSEIRALLGSYQAGKIETVAAAIAACTAPAAESVADGPGPSAEREIPDPGSS
ncbi:MAG: hypothetical protein IPM29_32150 [Planctomycetes bacterium]|nr:hypothetical protein [Planctomycetota bacterium]